MLSKEYCTGAVVFVEGVAVIRPLAELKQVTSVFPSDRLIGGPAVIVTGMGPEVQPPASVATIVYEPAASPLNTPGG